LPRAIVRLLVAAMETNGTGRHPVGLCALVGCIRRADPAGRRCSAREQRARRAKKARLQSALLDAYSSEVRVLVNRAMSGVVSLSVPGLEGSASDAVLEALSSQARARVEERLEAAENESLSLLGGAARR
jgi:hypothetical protein